MVVGSAAGAGAPSAVHGEASTTAVKAGEPVTAPPGEAPISAAKARPSSTRTEALPHAASVFYAVDDHLRLIFLSMPTSSHGIHIGPEAPVAVTVTEQYDDWELIQGVQLWGTAKRLTGTAKAPAMAVYLRRFPFVRELLQSPRLAETVRRVGVYRVDPERVAFTDNTTGVFGREVLELKG
jgi:uncharacterized protein YhbP (UPF0306 family)